MSGAEPHAASPLRRESRQILRFVVAGAINTGLSVLVYQAALFVMPHAPSYVLAYLAGIAIAYVLYSRQVFDAPLGTTRFAAFTVFYLLSLAVNRRGRLASFDQGIALTSVQGATARSFKLL